MPTYRPRSIVSLILIGFAIVLAPFVIAVVTAVVQVDRFAIESRAAVLNAGSATDESRVLVAQVDEMRRALGQYAVLGDPDFYDNYLGRRARFRTALENLMALDPAEIDVADLESLARDEAAIADSVDTVDGLLSDEEWEAADESLRLLGERARGVLNRSGRLVRDQASEVTARAGSLQRTLLVIAAAAAPATAFLVVVFTILITRPMRALGSAIRGLGSNTVDQPIAVQGPQDIEALAQELEWLRRRIVALEAQKSAFLQHISHELKTPLTTIREGSELLTESLGEDHPEEAEISRLLLQNGLHLQRLIENLLQFARTQELAMDLQFQPAVDLSLLIADSVAALAVVSESKDVTVDMDLLPICVRCDESKIKTVIDNLLTNAIKYTPAGGRIGVALASGDRTAVIDVRDTGPGVNRDEELRIFEPFQQGSAEYESSVKGTGLGLSIAREYVEAHSGTIGLIDSDRGAHFRVILPLAGPAGASLD